MLERDDDETNENVHHEESNDDDIDDVIDSNQWAIVELGPNPRRCGVDGIMKNAKHERLTMAADEHNIDKDCGWVSPSIPQLKSAENSCRPRWDSIPRPVKD